jgi:hypothetical protein
MIFPDFASIQVDSSFTKGSIIIYYVVRRSPSKMAILDGLPFGAALPACFEIGGMGRGQLWGQFALFALVRGDDEDLPEISASDQLGFARLTSAKSAMHSCAHAMHSAL